MPFNGDGRQYSAVVQSIHKKQVDLTVTGVEAPPRELGFRLEIAVPLPKADRTTFLVEKLTELGVTSLVPLRTARSVVHPRETRLEKLQRTVIEASKQCGRNVLMKIEALAEWAEYCQRGKHSGAKILAHPGQMDWQSFHFTAGAGNAILAVGPEGGFTEEEVAQARAAGWHTISLGPRTLRVDTAALLLAAMAIQGRGH